MDNFLDTLAREMSGKKILPGAVISSHQPLDNGIALIVVSHSFDGGPERNLEALNRVLGDRASAIPGSFRKLPVGGSDRITSAGYVQANQIIEPLTDARKSRMVEVAKNILMDSNDRSAWDVVESNGDRFIRRQASDDITSILAHVTTPRPGEVRASTLGFAAPEARAYVCYVDSGTKSIGFGYVVASENNNLFVLPRDGNNLLSVNRSFVVSMAHNVDTKDGYLAKQLNQAEADAKRNKATASLPDKEKLLEYYRRLYSYAPDYLSQVEDTINKQASL